jgi:hypothetical protein
VDIGQTGAESWTVLADPEGNEFCVVRPKDTLIALVTAWCAIRLLGHSRCLRRVGPGNVSGRAERS